MGDPLQLWRGFLARPNDDRVKIFGVAFLTALVSAVFVSVASVALRPMQEAHLAAERAARLDAMLDTLPGLRGLMEELGVDTLETRMVDLAAGTFTGDRMPAGYDMFAAATDPAHSVAIPPEQDTARLGRRALLAPVHLLERDGALLLIVLPVAGRGYQSTIRATLALEADLRTVAALTITEQAETPGLGARVENAEWQALWPGKELVDDTGAIVIEVVLGTAQGPHQVDAITGATVTSNGVANMLRYWLGTHGYGPFLDRLVAGTPDMALTLRTLTKPLLEKNPVTVQTLGICSALAVTTTLQTALVMSAALTCVLVLSAAVISVIRHHIPGVIRLIVQIIIISSLVVVADEVLRAFAFEVSRQLSIFVGLIVTNCLVLGRTEAFASRNPVWPAILDAGGNGLGYSLVLILVGTLREILGAGTLLGHVLLPTQAAGGWFVPLGLMQLAPAGFFILGLLVWAIRSLRIDQTAQGEVRQ